MRHVRFTTVNIGSTFYWNNKTWTKTTRDTATRVGGHEQIDFHPDAVVQV